MTVDDGELRGVEILPDAGTFKVVREVLSFPRIGRVEIERFMQSAPALIPGGSPGRVSPSNVKLPPPEALDNAELQARFVLGQSGLDMTARSGVLRTPAGVRIESGSLPVDQQSRLAAKLAAIDLVRIDFHDAGMAYQTPPELRPVRIGLREWLTRSFRYPATRESFCPRLFQTLDTVHHRVTLLVNLAERYPDPQTQLFTKTREKLQELVDPGMTRVSVMR